MADAPVPLPEFTRQAEQRFEEALRERDGAGMAAAVLELEEAIQAWQADTDEDQGTIQARAVLRGLIARLGAACGGPGTVSELLGPAIAPLLAVRRSLRSQRRYGDADATRDALAVAGVQVRDDRTGASWEASPERAAG